jgi:hypothetical protein
MNLKETARQAALVVAGVGTVVGIGLAGAGLASAAAPALKIKPGATTWTIEVGGASPCEVDTFNTTTHHFTSDLFSDKGTWSGGGSTISMVWTKGTDMGGTFNGTFTKTPPKGYAGPFGGTLAGESGTLVKGAVPGC